MTAGNPNAPNDPLYTQREEDKFIIPIKYYDRVVSAVEERLKPYYPNKSTEFNKQRSLYLDTPDLKFIRDHLFNLNNRYKIRFRWYGPNGKYNDEAFIESKYKKDGESMKVRLRVDKYSVIQIMGGKPLPDKLQKLNKEISDDDYQKAVRVINNLATNYELQPAVNVEYHRLCFANKDETIRVSIDRDITVTSLRKNLSGDPLKEDNLWNDLQGYLKK